MPRTTPTERHVDAMLGIYYRLDTGRNTGRNSNGTFSALDMHWRQLRETLEGGGFEELDNSPALARKFDRLERRHLLGERWIREESV